MSIERINPGELAQPSGFSHAVAATGGRLVFLAGQTGYGPDGAIVGGGLVPQFGQALSNLLAALRAAGGEPTDLVSLTIYAVDLADYRARAGRSARPGASSAAGSTRPWPPSGCHGCGTPMRSSRYKASPS